MLVAFIGKTLPDNPISYGNLVKVNTGSFISLDFTSYHISHNTHTYPFVPLYPCCNMYVCVCYRMCVCISVCVIGCLYVYIYYL